MNGEDILRILHRDEGRFVSGEALARELGVSRTAVWKGVGDLRAGGFLIESVTNRGYRLSPGGDALSAAGIEAYLKTPGLRILYYPTLVSTNTLLREKAAAGAPEGLTIVAGEQTGGRGRRGRSFHSPAGTGLYMSVLLRPSLPPTEAVQLTACAAVAAAEAIESLSGGQAEIKWVNDILLRGKKVCGILTEAAMDVESGALDYAVVGVGINVRTPEGGFPEELRDIAGAVFPEEGVPAARCRLAAAFLDSLMARCTHPGDPSCYEAYKKRSCLPGRSIRILAPGKEPEDAVAVDVGRDYSLLVRTADGAEKRVFSGEVSVRSEKNK